MCLLFTLWHENWCSSYLREKISCSGKGSITPTPMTDSILPTPPFFALIFRVSPAHETFYHPFCKNAWFVPSRQLLALLSDFREHIRTWFFLLSAQNQLHTRKYEWETINFLWENTSSSEVIWPKINANFLTSIEKNSAKARNQFRFSRYCVCKSSHSLKFCYQDEFLLL